MAETFRDTERRKKVYGLNVCQAPLLMGKAGKSTSINICLYCVQFLLYGYEKILVKSLKNFKNYC